MAAKIVGRRLGIAKRARVTVVNAAAQNGDITVESVIDGMVRIYDELRNRAGRPPAVLMLALGYPANDYKRDVYTASIYHALDTLLKELMEMEVICVVGAGNKGMVSNVQATYVDLGY